MASLISKRVIVLKPENVAQLVFFMRGEKVMFDADLAMLYGVEVRSLNQAVARNRKRFPADFAFQLTDDELAALRSQLVISKSPTSQASSLLRSQIVTSNTGRGWPALPALRFYRARRCHAFELSPQRSCRRGQYRNHAHFRAAPPFDGQQPRLGAQDRSAREKI